MLDDESLARAHHLIISHIVIHREALIATPHWDEAHALCEGVDLDDTAHVALTLQLGGVLWTGDKRLREGLKAKGFDRFFVP